MAKETPDWLKKLMPFGFQQMPGNKPGGDLMGNLMYSMGQPGVFNSQGSQSIYQNMMNQNLQNGLPPFTGFPEGWNTQTPTDDTTPDDPDNPDRPPNRFAKYGLPRWYYNWAMTNGIAGRNVPRRRSEDEQTTVVEQRGLLG